MTDPIADFLTRIRNAITARKAKVQIPGSTMKLQLAKLLQTEGFVSSVAFSTDEKQGTIDIELRYGSDNRNAIEGIRRVSRPGQRRYVRHDHIPKVRSGLGIAIVTTSRGLMTDRQAIKEGVGGELVCEVW